MSPGAGLSGLAYRDGRLYFADTASDGVYRVAGG
jgi:hypothetical protein